MEMVKIKRIRESAPRYLKVDNFDDIAALKPGQIVGSESGFMELHEELWTALEERLSHTWDTTAENGQTYRLGEIK